MLNIKQCLLFSIFYLFISFSFFQNFTDQSSSVWCKNLASVDLSAYLASVFLQMWKDDYRYRVST